MDFKAKYNRNAFVDFFSASLLPEDFETATEIVEPDFKSKYFQSITYLGQSPSLDLNVYEIRHSSEKDARVGLSRDAFKLVSRYGANNALILFVPENPDNFRLSLVTIEPKLDAKGVKILKEYSNPRRYSFVLGDDAKTHTPEQYLIALGRISNNADLTKRFSVEVVNKEFYGQIAEMFSKLVGGQRKKGNRTVEYQRQLVLPSVSATHDQKYKEFAVRLIGRTVFCWFLKKKKSDKNVPLIHNDVLSRFAADFTSNFYHARVEPLFFEVLNTSVEKRKPEYKKDPFNKIPFLNGGLFEPHLDDFYKVNHVTGTSEYLNTLKIPDDWWKELLDILETYNFTIDENTSIDIDLSVDPEMLGRIFENLLAEINPETGDTARKATGSYYTPRPIVEYMVDQSLKQYLVTKTALDETKYDILLDYSNEASGLSEAEEKTVIEALNAIKILDPACGSGAFPMGMLQKMLLILQKVDHNAQNSVQQILNGIADPIKRELIKHKLEAAQVLDDVDFDDYARKLNVIQRSIYGVDIQPIATDISKLRFFLSLVVDEVIQDEAPNRGIEPLPNLEFKFVCANTLIPLPEADNFEKMFGDAELVSDLENIRTRYFTASNDDKPALKKEFEGLQKKLYDFIAQNKDILSNPNGRLAILAAWKPFSDEAAEWFDPKWMFGVSVKNELKKENKESSEITLINIQIQAINKQIEAINLSLKESFDSTIVKLELITVAKQVKIIETELQFIKETIEELYGRIEKGINDIVNEPENFNYKINSLNNKIRILNQEITKINSNLKPVMPYNPIGCFDIVIGNPPYVQLQKEGGKLSKLYEKLRYSTFERTGDIYSLFYECGFNLLAENGLLTFITSNKWMRTNYGKSTRIFFTSKTKPLMIIDFGNVQIFENATVDTNIFILQNKTSNDSAIKACRFSEKYDAKTSFESYIRQNYQSVTFNKDEAWVIAENDRALLIDKIYKQGIQLRDWDININYGIKTGLNEAFIIDNNTKNKLIDEDTKSAKLLRPILRGKDIKKWNPDFADLYLIGTFPSLKIDIDKYPAIKNLLAKFGIEKLIQDGTGRKKTGNEWFETQDQIAYWKDFEKPKIIYPNMTKYLPFVYDENEHYYHNDKSFHIVGKSLKWLVAFLNSTLFKFAFSDAFPELQGGTRELRKVFFDKIPVKKITLDIELLFNNIVDDLYSLKKKDCEANISKYEIQIDLMVYKLYKLTFDEIKIIDPEIENLISSEDYERLDIEGLAKMSEL